MGSLRMRVSERSCLRTLTHAPPVGPPTYVSESEIPVLMIKSSDATHLREHGSALIRDKGTNRFYFNKEFSLLCN